MKATVKIIEYPNRFWHTADIKIINHGGCLRELIEVNRYYDVDKDWIYIYDTCGGHDNIKRGRLLRKINISGYELETLVCRNSNPEKQ